MPTTETLPDIRDAVSSAQLTYTIDQVLELRQRAKFFLDAARKTYNQCDQYTLEYCDAHGISRIDMGDDHYIYISTVKKTTCKDQRQAVEALLDASSGDLDRVCQCLASGALKHGQCRTVLGDKWSEHFMVKEVKDIKEGKAVRKVQIADERFTTKRITHNNKEQPNV